MKGLLFALFVAAVLIVGCASKSEVTVAPQPDAADPATAQLEQGFDQDFTVTEDSTADVQVTDEDLTIQ